MGSSPAVVDPCKLWPVRAQGTVQGPEAYSVGCILATALSSSLFNVCTTSVLDQNQGIIVCCSACHRLFRTFTILA